MTDYLSRENALWIAFITNASEETKERLQNWTAADVQPVKRGEWNWNSKPTFGNPYGSYECSECKNRADFKYNYCCSCGAEMKNAE